MRQPIITTRALPTYTFYHTALLLSTKVISETQYFGMFVCHLLVLEIVGGMREVIILRANRHRVQQRIKDKHVFPNT